MTARDQARQAAVKGWENFTPDEYRETMRISRLVGADASSDVWEPYLREIINAVEEDFSPHQSRGAKTIWAIKKAKAALGD